MEEPIIKESLDNLTQTMIDTTLINNPSTSWPTDISAMDTNSDGNIDLYLAPYVGDIDGSIDPSWFVFYNQLRQSHDDNNIPGLPQMQLNSVVIWPR